MEKFKKIFYGLYVTLLTVHLYKAPPPAPPPPGGGGGGTTPEAPASPIDMYIVYLGVIAIFFILYHFYKYRERKTV